MIAFKRSPSSIEAAFLSAWRQARCHRPASAFHVVSGSVLARELLHDLPLHALTALYLLITAVTAVALDATDRLVLTVYLWLWMRAAALCLMMYLLVVEVTISAIGRSRRPLTAAVIRMWGRIGFRALPALALLINMAVFYGAFTSLKNMLPLFALDWQDKQIADFSRWLHFGYTPWRLLHLVLGQPAVTRFVEFLYVPVWLGLLIGLPILLGLRRDLAQLRVRYILTMFLCFALLGNAVAALGMSGGPAFYGQITGDHARYGELIDYLAFSSGRPFSAWDIQQYLWACFQAGKPQLGSGISAFPSLHVAMATLFVLAGRQLAPWLGRVLAVYGLLILLGSVHLGWHYAIDGYASMLGTMLLWSIAGWIARRLSRSTTAAETGSECLTKLPGTGRFACGHDGAAGVL